MKTRTWVVPCWPADDRLDYDVTSNSIYRGQISGNGKSFFGRRKNKGWGGRVGGGLKERKGKGSFLLLHSLVPIDFILIT